MPSQSAGDAPSNAPRHAARTTAKATKVAPRAATTQEAVAAARTRVGAGARESIAAASAFAGRARALLAAPEELRRAASRQLTELAPTTGGRRAARLRFDPDRRPTGQTRLLATLAAIRQADEASSALRGQLDRFLAVTTPLIAEARRTTSRIAMFFAGRRRRNAALLALARLDATMAHPRVAALRRPVAHYEKAADPGGYRRDRLWRDYTTDAASFHALLSTIADQEDAGPDGDDAARGFVTPELRQKIAAVPLDTSQLTARLRGYQVFGAQYAIHQRRSILGDEMGLGKTVQALAVLAHLAARGERRFLVVCPASVQVNWLNEIARHTTLPGHSLHGRDRDRATRQWRRDGGVAVTTYSTLGRLPRAAAAGVAMLVVDEAHFVKNPGAARSGSVRRVARKAERVCYLTGTPMENRVQEFRNLVEHLWPKVAARIDGSDAVSGARAFRRAVAPVYLRRNQEDVLAELPDKIEVEDWVQPTARDEAAYVKAVRARNIMAMRQAGFSSARSAKAQRLCELVREAGEDGMKVVVFSYFLGVLDIVGKAIGRSVAGVIDGSVPPAARQDAVNRFTAADGHAVLLSQIEAGGVGLNIQAASLVILTEPQWKPSVEAQAIARAHRMGQVRKVQVHRLLAKGTVDERLRELQDRKRLLFDEFARKSEAKGVDPRAVDGSAYRPAILDDRSVPLERRVIIAEQHRLGLA